MLKKVTLFIFIIIFSKAEAQTSALAIADSLYATGNYTTAINQYAKVGTKQSHLQIARAYHHIGNFDKAIAQYEALILKDTALQIAAFELGKLYVKVKNSEKALPLFSELSQRQPNPEYFYYLGMVQQDLGKNMESIAAFKKAVVIDSTHLRSLFQLGKHYLGEREYNLAQQYINKGLTEYPQDVSLINLKALTFYNNDQYQEAKPLFELLIDLGEEKDFLFEKLATCYYKLWEFEAAKHTYLRLLEFENAIPKAYFGLGEVYWRTTQRDSAAIYFHKAIASKKPFLAKEYTALAGLAREENKLSKALEYYKLAFEEDTENHINYYQICTVADQLFKDPKLKLAYYEKFIAQFGNDKPYFSQIVDKRISELKEEIHFVSE
ncbi:tetratricopeptide repeat protein [Arenibacter sp. GZD96]|uniref:tetratricopeptide repeat protein n=1 Tax=Aurantibrevibacter litoralis TaxID=3106030 RepID=UPI002AFE223D|nr:tetratricopeptide repeat protein [Arenibacter sp. GZD-96]MEA1784483.1 tetratricopeptide repeat protein [Arenibacter sp. GZD-96]